MRGVWLLLLTTSWCLAQDTFVLAGTVVNAKTGEPVKRALVTAIGGASPQLRSAELPASPFTATGFTDDSGTFRFTGVTAGQYFLRALSPHFAPGPMAGTLVRIESASREDVRLTLSPLASIEGQIMNQRGEPASAASVLLLRISIVAGWRQMSVERSVQADDRGVFRFWNIVPGRYLVKAAGRASQTANYLGDPPPVSQAGYDAYLPAYFGGPTADSATVNVIEPGSEVRADFAVTVQPAYRIRGTLSDLGSGRVTFSLLSGEENVGTGRVMVSPASGAFEMLEVPNGSYTLRAEQDDAVGELPIVVQGSDLSGLHMALAEGVKIPVNIHILNQPEGGDGVPAENGRAVDVRPAASCMVTLHGGLGTGRRPVALDPAESLIQPGKYRVEIGCADAYVVSASMGSVDLLAIPWIEVPRAAAPPPIDVVARYGGGTIAGTVKLEVAASAQKLFVLAVPSRSTRDAVMASTSNRGGSNPFWLGSLAPGDYALYGFSTDQIEYHDPEFLQGLSGGQSVHVEDGAQASVIITRLER